MATEQKPKELIRSMPLTWWLKNPAYTRFMIREITSLFIAGYCIFLLVVLYRATHDDAQAFAAFYASWGSTPSRLLHLLALVFAVYHSITFFNLTPRVVVLFQGEEKVPEATIAGLHFGLWAVVSLVIIIIGMVA